MIDYYARIADAILPHLRDRPLTLKRYPNGVGASSFYEKRCPGHRPEWVETAPVWSGRNEGDIDYCLCNDKATLIWMAQLAALELHPSLSLAEEIERPTVLAFDLDPGRRPTSSTAAGSRLRLRELFGGLGLECFPKTSGSKGLQVYVPLNAEIDLRANEAVRPRGGPGARARRARSWSSRGWRRSCARARCSSTGARTTSTRRPWRSTRCGRGSGRPSRRRVEWEEVERRARARGPGRAQLRGRRGDQAGRRSAATCSPRCWSCARSCRTERAAPLAAAGGRPGGGWPRPRRGGAPGSCRARCAGSRGRARPRRGSPRSRRPARRGDSRVSVSVGSNISASSTRSGK